MQIIPKKVDYQNGKSNISDYKNKQFLRKYQKVEFRIFSCELCYKSILISSRCEDDKKPIYDKYMLALVLYDNNSNVNKKL